MPHTRTERGLESII